VASATYNAANHQLTFGGQSLTHDLNGNLTSDGTTTYTWDARNRLASLSGGGTSASFQYDPLGRRTRKVVNATTTDFLFDGVNPVQELTGGMAVANVLSGLRVDEYFARTDSNGTRMFLTDTLASTVALTDNASAVQNEYTYEPFGMTSMTGAPNGNPFDYTGRENDGIGLKYYRARYYDPQRQRFIAEDPIGFAGSDVNLYAYVFNSPVALRDPTGLAVEPVSWGAAAIMCGSGAALGVTATWAIVGRKATWGQLGQGAAMGCGAGMLMLVSYIAAAGAAGSSAIITSQEVTTAALAQAPQLAQIWANPRLFENWLKANHSLTRISNPLSHSEARKIIENATRLKMKIDPNEVGLKGREKTGQWASIPHFKVESVHIPVQPGFIP
jgi:RHS repeat-associated protein